MARAGAKKRTILIDRVLGLSFGVAAEGELGRGVLRDAWGLTPRQMHLAAAVAAGATREEAAVGTGVSGAVAKKELSSVFLTLGVSSGAELSAFLAEASALSALVAASGGDVAAPADGVEPTALTPRPAARGMIAYSDYGPKGGEPTLVLHSSSASRPAPTRLVKALQARGFRPFAIDRPGFGLTDWIEAPGDPFAKACDDVRTICDKLRFPRIDVVARGGAQVALHLAAQSPSLVGAVVLVAPDPPSRISRPTSGALGAVKQAFQSNPALIEPLARLFVANIRASNVRDLMMKTVRSSPADLAVMADPQNVSDYCRGYRMFLAGRLKGYVREQSALVTQPDPPANPAARWDVLIGEQDPLHDPAETARYFRALLPAAEISTLADAGRFVVMSHAGLVADLLAAQRRS
jgi:pimeloyl-ACP methyl ester carboxylesterase/DNA-binding CsgD family transcriptional regulator